MAQWVENESGPDCFCGWPTVVKPLGGGKFGLLCFGHTPDAGQMFELPQTKPDDWPTKQQLIDMGLRGREHVAKPKDGYLCICCDCCNKRKELDDKGDDE